MASGEQQVMDGIADRDLENSRIAGYIDNGPTETSPKEGRKGEYLADAPQIFLGYHSGYAFDGTANLWTVKWSQCGVNILDWKSLDSFLFALLLRDHLKSSEKTEINTNSFQISRIPQSGSLMIATLYANR